MTATPDSATAASQSTETVRVGIITALPVESAAMEIFLDGVLDQPIDQDHYHYRSGTVPSKAQGRPHRVVWAMPTRDGTREAAATCADMLRSFPGIAVVMVCGIAGGTLPAEAGMRFGDVVAGTEGVVDYGHVRQVNGVTSLRRFTNGLSAALLRADREIQSAALLGREPWRDALAQAQARFPRFRCPAYATDPRRGGQGVRAREPEVFRGAVGSADVLLRDAAYRDELAGRHELSAVEMEAAGVAAAVDAAGRHWFVVRGISDYCENETKNDVWHDYSALTAAAYARGLLAQCPPFDAVAASSAGAHRQVAARAVDAWVENGSVADARDRLRGTAGLAAVVDAMVRIPQLADDYQRRTILAVLPPGFRSAVPDSVNGRIHLVGLVETADRLPGGRETVIDALRLALGEDSADLTRLLEVIAVHWPARAV
ncbi:effector-associated domain 2-containing protein [Actinospica robiniae]|uniref:phosphorylase family protein n=1 Tax=Actinospica robiniae TaxID=304901 RepID=UPI0003F61C2B|nr:hypothetical protein [Actinospica robiniae]